MVLSLQIASLLFLLGSARSQAAGVEAGATSVDAFPPNSTQPNTALFPPESVVGYAGPTKTGAEGFTYQTAPAKVNRYSKNTDAFAPVVLPIAADKVSSSRSSELRQRRKSALGLLVGCKGHRYLFPDPTLG